MISVTETGLCVAGSSPPMNLEIITRTWLRVLCFAAVFAIAPALLAQAPAPSGDAASDKDMIVSTTPMQVVADDGGVHGQLVVGQEILRSDARDDLVYT